MTEKTFDLSHNQLNRLAPDAFRKMVKMVNRSRLIRLYLGQAEISLNTF